MTSAPAGPADGPRPVGRLGPWFASIWLFFLADPLLEGWAKRDELAGVVGIVATIAFAATYMTLWMRARSDRAMMIHRPPIRVGLAYLAILTVVGLVMLAALGEPALAFVVYVAVACVMVLPIPVAAPLVVSLVLGVIGLSAVEHWGSQVGTAFSVMAASVAVFGLRTVMSRNIDLIRAHEVNANLAVENERSRFARDLHDILGHSLTVITVKAELAQRLMDVDVDRARREVIDLERLSRDALADVRRAVEGYRDLSLPGELARARTALEAAQIDVDIPNSTEEVPSDLRELFAWTVREGVTNVIRHSAAGHCQVLLAPDRAEVRDDGIGADPTVTATAPGSGLLGLRERAAALGATVVTRHLEPGFSLSVVRSAS